MDSAAATSLPPLVDNNYIAFDHQAGMQNLEGYEQVPCFSSFNNNSASSYLPMVAGSNGMSYLDHGLPDYGSYLDPAMNCDKKVLKAVLSQLSSMGGEVVPSLPPEMAAAVSSNWMNHF
jgi:hypothetical protein